MRLSKVIFIHSVCINLRSYFSSTVFRLIGELFVIVLLLVHESLAWQNPFGFVLELIGRELPTPIVITTTMLMKNRLMGKCIRGGVFTFWAFFMKKETFFPHGFIGIDPITTKVHHRVQVRKKSLCIFNFIFITRSFWLGKI